MDISTNTGIPKLPCYCINLNERADRWDEIQKTFQGSGVKLQRFPAIKERPGWVGCAKSHVAAVQMAAEEKMPWVMIVEDDCLLVPEFTKRWPSVKDAAWSCRTEWDIFLGGPTHIKAPISVLESTAPIVEVSHAYALQFTVIQASAYSRILAWREKDGPIDVYYAKQLRIATTHPFLAIQQPSYSDIENGAMDYTKVFINAENTLMSHLYSFSTRSSTIVLVIVSLLALAVLKSR